MGNENEQSTGIDSNLLDGLELPIISDDDIDEAVSKVQNVEEPAEEEQQEEKPSLTIEPVDSEETSEEPKESEETTETTNNEESQVSKLVSDKMANINKKENVYGVGRVVSVKDFIIDVVGLESVSFNEKVNIENKGLGYIVQLRPNRVSIAILTQTDKISIGDSVYQTNELLEGEFSTESFGRVIDLFGNDKLTNMKFSNTIKLPIELETVPIMDRKEVKRPLETGITGIDLIYPIGKGQRQLIIGDKKTGKTQICLDAIVNQKDKNMICIYVAIGKTKKEVKEIYYNLLKKNANSYTIIITAFYDDLPSIITLTPYFALSVADYYMKSGYDVLVVLDDLKKHADAYRQISLISGKSPGRDAYPADIFYFHSRLLERGCQYKDGGSITILPVVETKSGDITDYISTNIISITDGQIVLSRPAFVRGEKPAINYGLSVSRLGGSVQEPDMKILGAKVRQTLLSYLETRSIYELANTDEMSKELQDKLFRGKEILNALLQYKYSPLSRQEIIKKFEELDKKIEQAQQQRKEEEEKQREEAEKEKAKVQPVNDNKKEEKDKKEDKKEEKKEEQQPETPVVEQPQPEQPTPAPTVEQPQQVPEIPVVAEPAQEQAQPVPEQPQPEAPQAVPEQAQPAAQPENPQLPPTQ